MLRKKEQRARKRGKIGKNPCIKVHQNVSQTKTTRDETGRVCATLWREISSR
jgi:hypothetical protein